MDQRTRLEAKIGFDRIREIISGRCQTEFAVQRVEREEFSDSADEIRRRLSLTDEMRLVVMFEDSFPLTGYIDTVGFLEPLEKQNSSIDALNLGKLSTLLDSSRKITNFFSSVKDSVYPGLKSMSGAISVFPEVRRRIEDILDRYGEIKDSASPQLEKIRHEIRRCSSSLSKKAESILLQAKQEGICEDGASVSVRDGKLLIPVQTSLKRKIQGFTYGVSSTGKTTFIEPAGIIELENEISDLRYAEQEEIARILFAFSEFLRPYIPDLLKNARILGEFDFLIAKAQTALDLVCGMPVISDEGRMDLRKARHPLLEKALKKEGRQMCPLTVRLDRNKRILIISGPNAGGKSVCLKTVGLLQYMFQWGMLIPTSESSEMPVFDRILVSIGDDQSLENDLSTYSSFLGDMRGMLSLADSKTLVLIDEFGSGTEPAAGGAIAEAILSRLDQRGTYGVITTHYTALKLYAAGENTHVCNAAMLYDPSRIEPLFKLEIGLPGNSFAFELARKMHLPEDVVKDAESRCGQQYVSIEKNLRRIVRNRRALEEKIQKVQHKDKALEGLAEQYEAELSEIRDRKKQILDDAKKEAQGIVRDAGARVEKTIREIKEAQAEKERTKEVRSDLQGFMYALEQKKTRDEHIERKINQLRKRKKPSEVSDEQRRLEQWRNAPLKIGEKVKVKSNGMVGEVVGASAKLLTVTIGNITTKISPDKVERISSNEFREASKRDFAAPAGKVDPVMREHKLNFSPELDIRGERLQSAMDIVSHYIDDALLVGIGSVRIIHGKGTGVLRDEIQKFLRTVPGISSVRDEDIRLGGSGVTVVEF